MKKHLAVLVCILCMAITPQLSLAASGEGQPLAPAPDFEYVDLKPLIMPVITEKGLTQQVSLVISLEIPYGMRETIRAKEPKLADAYISDLYGVLGAGGLMKNGALDMPVIKDRLLKATQRVLKPEEFKDVLLQVAQQTYK